MVSKFQFYLDNTLVQDPKGWEDLDTTIKRDYTLQGLLLSQESQPEFYGDGYDYIKNKFDTSGFCDSIAIEIRQTCDQLNYETIFNGIIFLSDCVFDLERCSVKVKTVDDGYYAKINNNKSIKALLNVGRSKNNGNSPNNIDPCPTTEVHLFVPDTGVYHTFRNMYKAFDLFTFLVDFITDGTMGFASDDFGPGGEYEGTFIMTGQTLNYDGTDVTIPEISFQEALTELNKKNRLGFSVERIGGVPTLRIERAEYFYSQETGVTLSDASGVTMQMDTSQLYSLIHLGGQTDNSAADGNGVPHFPADTDFIGHKDETFNIVGNCNVDRTLDLSGQWIVCTNIIEQILINNVDSYDSNIILIKAEHLGGYDPDVWHAEQSDWINHTGADVYYNEFFNNKNVTERWIGGIPNNIARYLGNEVNTFQASKTTQSGFASPGVDVVATFDDETTAPNNDIGNNYDGASIYTIPQGGQYTFGTLLKYRIGQINVADRIVRISGWNSIPPAIGEVITNGSGEQGIATFWLDPFLWINMTTSDFAPLDVLTGLSFGFSGGVIGISALPFAFFWGTLEITIELRDSTLATLKQSSTYLHAVDNTGSGSAKTSTVFNAAATDKVRVSYKFVAFNAFSGTIATMIGSNFKCTAATTGGGLYTNEISPENYKIKKYSFNYPITFAQYEAIKLDPKKLLTMTTNNGVSQTGWIDEIKYYRHNKAASVKLISN